MFIDRIKEKKPASPKFNHPWREDYKATYADNILYTKGYLEFKTNPANQEKVD